VVILFGTAISRSHLNNWFSHRNWISKIGRIMLSQYRPSHPNHAFSDSSGDFAWGLFMTLFVNLLLVKVGSVRLSDLSWQSTFE
jgi:hypothetical protein